MPRSYYDFGSLKTKQGGEEMFTILSESTLYCFDMLKLESGEILTLCGNFDGSWCRARLSFIPDTQTTRLIGGIPYKKVDYETGYQLPKYKKLLDLPGEQHFLVHRRQITKIYRASEAFTGLSPKNSRQCQLFIDLLYKVCQLNKDRHGLTGGGALHNILPTSDFDWVIYNRDPAPIEKFVLSNTGSFKRELTFDMEHAYKKYRVFKGLNRERIDSLFKNRWKYFRFQKLRISLSFTDPLRRVDDFLGPFKLRKRVTFKGVVTDGIGCYHMPYVIPLRCNGSDHLALTWLFLYNGAFRKGDAVEISGRECIVKEEKYVLVEGLRDYIRKLIS